MTAQQTKGQRVGADITALLRSRHTLLWVVTREETRVERAIVEAAGAAKYNTYLWDCAAGLVDSAGKAIDSRLGDPSAVLDRIAAETSRGVYVLRDMHAWVRDPTVQRRLRNLAKSLQQAPLDQLRAVVVLTPSSEIPPELAGHVTVVEFPIPDRAEVAAILDTAIASLPTELQASAAPNGTRDASIDAAVGLSAEEIANCYSKSLVVTRGKIDPLMVNAEKKRVIEREKVLTWHDPDPRGLDAVGGLENLKTWLVTRRTALGARARAYGLPAPKGALLVGHPGTGKSLAAKCLASAWGVPLLRLDLGALKSKFVGESEANIRKALAVAEAVSPCVLWVDEIEKALAGATGPQGDGGVGSDALGALLSWMQERTGSVFVLATANDVRALPPELLRKGRFDELWFVDLPTHAERAAVVRASLAQYGRNVASVDAAQVATACAGFTGAEIAALVPDAMYAAFADGERAVTTADLLQAASSVVPLSRTASEKIEALREWAKTRARPAGRVEVIETQAQGRALDLS